MKTEQTNQKKININQNHAESCVPQLLRSFRFPNKIQSILRSRCSESQPLSINDETLNNNLSGWTEYRNRSGENQTKIKTIPEVAVRRTRESQPYINKWLRYPIKALGYGSRYSQAFTLIELLVVVLIIGILAAIAVPQYQKAVLKTRLANLKPLVRSIAEAQHVYYLANGQYADDFEKLDIQMPGKKVWSNQKTYVYDWGSCHIDLTGQGNFAASYCYTGNIGYLMQNDFVEARCLVQSVDTQNSIPAKVCQADTGNPTYKEYYGYIYKN